MTNNTLNDAQQLLQLINKQESDINILKSTIEIALGECFLEHEKTTIHSHFCIVDDYIDKISNNNKEIMRYLHSIIGN